MKSSRKKEQVKKDITKMQSKEVQDQFRKEMAWRCFDLIGTVIVTTDLDGKITLANKRTCDLLGYEEDELIGKPWLDLLVSDSDKAYFKGFWIGNKLREKVGMEIIRFEIRTRKGRRKYIEFKIVVVQGEDIPDSLLLSGKDVTEFIKIQNELQQSLQRHRTLASSIPGVNMYLFDKQMRYIIAEGSELKNLGLSPSYFEGKKLTEIFDAKVRNALVPLYKVALEGKEISTEFIYRDNYYTIWVYPLRNHEGEVYGGMAITQNITREKIDSEKLSEAKRMAEEANQTKSEFLANISHEIRTPLSAIVGFAEQMLKTNLEPRQQQFIEIIEKSSEQLLSLVNDLLILSKIEAGRIDFDEDLFKIENVVNYVYQSMKTKASEKNIDFEVIFEEGAKGVVVGDEFRLSQILINLVSNAIKFTDKGEVKIKCYRETETEGKSIINFEISDTGVGIPKDKVNIIFEQFKQADSAVTKKYGGTGLGLTISKRLVEMQKGKITVTSKLHKGTVFVVSLPFKKGDEFAYIKPRFDEQKISFKGKSALVVDDDSVNRLLGQTILTGLGFDVDLAASGAEAIEKLNKNSYDFLILDIHMPGVSGIDVADFLRLVKKDRKTKILAVTAAFMKEDIRKYKTSGIDDYLIKPFRENKLYSKMCLLSGYGVSEHKEPKQKDSRLHPNVKGAMYDLAELKAMAGNDREFIGSMLDTFINNVEEGIKLMAEKKNMQDWKLVGELAHKLIPSFVHLKVNKVIPLLKKIEKMTLHENNTVEVPKMVNTLIDQSERVIESLKKEKELLQN